MHKKIIKKKKNKINDEYEVEQILDKKIESNKELYLIKWKNYDNEDDNTWGMNLFIYILKKSFIFIISKIF